MKMQGMRRVVACSKIITTDRLITLTVDGVEAISPVVLSKVVRQTLSCCLAWREICVASRMRSESCLSSSLVV